MYAENTDQLTPLQRIDRDKVVRLRFWAHERLSGELLQYGEDLTYLHGGYGGVFPKVETRLTDCGVNTRVEVDLSPAEGYGERDPQRVVTQARHSLPPEAAEIGQVLYGELPDGTEHPYVVVAVDNETVTLDGNHPWAGKELSFVFEVMEVRDSIDAERRAGFPFTFPL